MRKFLIHLLMLIMLTPSLACGAIMCAGKAQAEMPTGQDMPCHDHLSEEQDSGTNNDVMLFKDCTKAALFKSGDHASLEAPDNSGKTFFVAWAAIVPDYQFMPAAAHAIRGPPPDWPDLSQTQPSVLLTTQRFRE